MNYFDDPNKIIFKTVTYFQNRSFIELEQKFMAFFSLKLYIQYFRQK